MQVVIHKAIGSYAGLILIAVFFKIVAKMIFVFVVKKYLPAVIASLHGMVGDFWNYAADLTGHGEII